MHLSDEQRQAQLKDLTVKMARDLIANRAEMADKSRVARILWQAMLDAPKWEIVTSEKPADFTEPEEIWSETPKIVRH